MTSPADSKGSQGSRPVSRNLPGPPFLRHYPTHQLVTWQPQGILDDVPVTKVREFEVGMLAHFKDLAPAVRAELEQKKALDATLEAKLKEEMGKFKTAFMKKA